MRKGGDQTFLYLNFFGAVAPALTNHLPRKHALPAITMILNVVYLDSIIVKLLRSIPEAVLTKFCRERLEVIVEILRLGAWSDGKFGVPWRTVNSQL
jgi:hypothetical protein